MHEDAETQPGFEDRHEEHAGEHLRAVDMLIGDDELQPRQNQYGNIDNQVFSDSAPLVLLDHSHKFSPLPIGFSGPHSASIRMAQRTSRPDPRSASRVP